MRVPEVTPLEFVQLMGDPVRSDLVRELCRSDRRVRELTERLAKPQNLVSYHLQQLRTAGVVKTKASAADGRDVYYRIDFGRCAELWSAASAALLPGLNLVAEPPDPNTPPRRGRPVLFLCTGNSSRSQMAEAFLRQRTDGAIEARSAGSHPKPLHPNAVRVMAERGIDISSQTSKHLRRFARTRFDHVITLCDKVREVCPDFLGQPETAHWSVADPALEGDTDAESYAAFVRTADDIDERVGVFVAQCTLTQREVQAHA